MEATAGSHGNVHIAAVAIGGRHVGQRLLADAQRAHATLGSECRGIVGALAHVDIAQGGGVLEGLAVNVLDAGGQGDTHQLRERLYVGSVERVDLRVLQGGEVGDVRVGGKPTIDIAHLYQVVVRGGGMRAEGSKRLVVAEGTHGDVVRALGGTNVCRVGNVFLIE